MALKATNGMPSATQTTAGRVNGLKPSNPKWRAGAYVRA
jgi:hypothetical protein